MFCWVVTHNRSCVIQNEPHIWHRSLWHLTYLVSLTRPGVLALASRGWVMSELWRLYQTQFTWNWRWNVFYPAAPVQQWLWWKSCFFPSWLIRGSVSGNESIFSPAAIFLPCLRSKTFTFSRKHQFWKFQQSPPSLLEIKIFTFPEKKNNFGSSNNLCNKCVEPIYLKISKDLQLTCNQYFRPGGRNCKSVTFSGPGDEAAALQHVKIIALKHWSIDY